MCAHPILEVYDDHNIHFVAPLAKQNDFYVEEAKATANEDQGSDGEDSIVTNETSDSYSTSELSGRSFSTFSTEASDLSNTTTTITACFRGSSSRGFTDSPKSVSREKSLSPAMEDPIAETQQEMVEAVSLASPLLVKAESSSPVSVDDDQEWENLGDFQPQDEEELEASVPRAQESATTPATPDSADLVLLGDLQDGQLRDEDVSPSKEMAPPVLQEDMSLLQNSIASNLEESGFSESVMSSTLQDSGLGSEEPSSSDPHLAAAGSNNAPTEVVAPATPPLQLSLQSSSPQPQQQPQSPQLVEIESDSASEHSTGSSSYEEVKLAEVAEVTEIADA